MKNIQNILCTVFFFHIMIYNNIVQISYRVPTKDETSEKNVQNILCTVFFFCIMIYYNIVYKYYTGLPTTDSTLEKNIWNKFCTVLFFCIMIYYNIVQILYRVTYKGLNFREEYTKYIMYCIFLLYS